MPSTDRVRGVSRRLRDLVEPLAANVYFAPEAHGAYGELGLSYLPGYFCSRGACMGQVPGEVVTAAFAVFNPDIVIPAVTEGWSKTDASSILKAREHGATASLMRILGDAPAGLARAGELLRRAADAATGEGRPIFFGLRSLGWPGDAFDGFLRAASLVPDRRGHCLTAAAVA